MPIRTIQLYSHVKEYRYEVLVRGDPLKHLEQFSRTFDLPVLHTTPDRTRLRLTKDNVQLQLGLQGLGMILQVRNGRYSIWYRTAKPKTAQLELESVLYAIREMRNLTRIAITRVEYYVCIKASMVAALVAGLPRARKRAVAPLNDRPRMKTFYSERFDLPAGVKGTIPVKVVLYQPRTTLTPGYAKLELKILGSSRKRVLSGPDRRAMAHALREMIARRSVQTLEKPACWNGHRVRAKGRRGRIEGAVVALLKDSKKHLLAFNKLAERLPEVDRRNLRATVLSMAEKGVVTLQCRKGRFRTVRLRTLSLVPSTNRNPVVAKDSCRTYVRIEMKRYR
jgi:hypothetical protein